MDEQNSNQITSGGHLQNLKQTQPTHTGCDVVNLKLTPNHRTHSETHTSRVKCQGYLPILSTWTPSIDNTHLLKSSPEPIVPCRTLSKPFPYSTDTHSPFRNPIAPRSCSHHPISTHLAARHGAFEIMMVC